MTMISLERLISKNSIGLFAKKDERVIKSYHFISNKEGTDVGKEIISAGLLGWSITDLLGSEKISVEFPLLLSAQAYIEEIKKIVENYYNDFLKNHAEIEFKQLTPTFQKQIQTSDEKIFLGKSGGKDSTLVELVLQKQGKYKIIPYNISFDDSDLGDYYIFERTYNSEEVSSINLQKLVQKSASQILL